MGVERNDHHHGDLVSLYFAHVPLKVNSTLERLIKKIMFIKNFDMRNCRLPHYHQQTRISNPPNELYQSFQLLLLLKIHFI